MRKFPGRTYTTYRFKFAGKTCVFFLLLFKWWNSELSLDLEEKLASLFGDLKSGTKQKFYRQIEYCRKMKWRTNRKWDAQIVEIRQVGEILIVTNVINRYIKKRVRENQKIASVIKSMRTYGNKRNHNSHRISFLKIIYWIYTK